MSKKLDKYKELCLQIPDRGIYLKRALERVNSVEEFEDFCRIKGISIPELKTHKIRRQQTVSEEITSPNPHHDAETKKSKSKRESKEGKDRRKSSQSSQPRAQPRFQPQTPGNTIVLNGCDGVVFGNVYQMNMSVTNVTGTRPKQPSAKPKMAP